MQLYVQLSLTVTLQLAQLNVFDFTVVLLSQYIRCNDKATVSARMSLVCLAHRLYHCIVSSVFVLTLF